MNSRIDRKEISRAGAIAAAVAVTGNLAVFASASAFGADFIVAAQGQRTMVSPEHVAVASVMPILGATALAVLARTTRRLRAIQAASVVVAAVSLGGPLSMGVDPATKVALALMHVLVAAAFVCALGHAIATAGRRFAGPDSTEPTPAVPDAAGRAVTAVG